MRRTVDSLRTELQGNYGRMKLTNEHISPSSLSPSFLGFWSVEVVATTEPGLYVRRIGIEVGEFVTYSSFSLEGQAHRQQAQHAKRTQALSNLPPYQPEIVRAVAREVRELDKDASETLAPFEGSFNPSTDPATAFSLLVDHLCMRRNKRCLLAYHRVRADKLERLCWDGQDVLEQQQQGSHETTQAQTNNAAVEPRNASSLSPEEEEYMRQYGDLLAAFKGQWTDVDLMGSLEPPKDLFIDVRVLKNAGEILTEYGSVTHITLPITPTHLYPELSP